MYSTSRHVYLNLPIPDVPGDEGAVGGGGVIHAGRGAGVVLTG